MRHNLPDDSGIFCFTVAGPISLSDESRHQLGELQKIRDQEERTALADDDRWIGRHDVRPLPRHGAHAIGVDAQQEPRAVPIVPLADADELPSAQRVERVRDAHKTRRCVGTACSLC